ncbi:MAG: hypothetical protein F3745_03670, partial [Nitrospinae bacterium]|nr:hypothetical protein [Nitrospinota bacterium]
MESSVKHLKKLFQFVIFFWVANTVQNSKQRDLLFKLVIVAGIASALNGLFPIIKPSLFSLENLYGKTRIIGTMGTPSTFSGIMMIVGLIALARLLFHKLKEYWVMGSVGIIGLSLLFSFTRQAWLGFFVGSVFLLFFWNKKYLLFIPLLIGGLLLFAPEGIKDRLNSYANLKDVAFQQR